MNLLPIDIVNEICNNLEMKYIRKLQISCHYIYKIANLLVTARESRSMELAKQFNITISCTDHQIIDEIIDNLDLKITADNSKQIARNFMTVAFCDRNDLAANACRSDYITCLIGSILHARRIIISLVNDSNMYSAYLPLISFSNDTEFVHHIITNSNKPIHNKHSLIQHIAFSAFCGNLELMKFWAQKEPQIDFSHDMQVLDIIIAGANIPCIKYAFSINLSPRDYLLKLATSKLTCDIAVYLGDPILLQYLINIGAILRNDCYFPNYEMTHSDYYFATSITYIMRNIDSRRSITGLIQCYEILRKYNIHATTWRYDSHYADLRIVEWLLCAGMRPDPDYISSLVANDRLDIIRRLNALNEPDLLYDVGYYSIISDKQHIYDWAVNNDNCSNKTYIQYTLTLCMEELPEWAQKIYF